METPQVHTADQLGKRGQLQQVTAPQLLLKGEVEALVARDVA